MSATSKLVGFSVAGDESGGDAGKQVADQRRRYLMRYVVVALSLAGIICVAAGVRVVRGRSAAAQDDMLPVASLHPTLPAAPPETMKADQAQAASSPPVAMAAAPVLPAVAAPQPASAVVAQPAQAPAEAVAASPAPGLPAAAPAAHVHSAPAAPPSAPRAQPHASSSTIVHAAPF
jgi:hypothetical protein